MIPNIREDFQRLALPDWTTEQFMQFVYTEWSGRQNPFLRGTPEWHQFVGFRREQDQRKSAKWEALPDVPVVRRASKRRMPQPTLKVPFSSLHDIVLRLRHTLIFVGSELYFVDEIFNIRDDFLLVVSNARGDRYKVWYSNPDIDLRSLEPQYITLNGHTNFLYRPPIRVQKQGMSIENMYVKPPGGHPNRLRDVRSLPQCISLDVFQWNPTLVELMVKVKALHSVRLSKSIAAYTDGQDAVAEYRGRRLGTIKDDVVFLDEHDVTKPWIIEAVRQVGCVPRQEPN